MYTTQSRTRTHLPGASQIQPFSSGVAGFRFLIDVQRLRDNPLTAEYVQQPGFMVRLVTRTDKQALVMYPCQNNEVSPPNPAQRRPNAYIPGHELHARRPDREHNDSWRLRLV